MKKTKAARIAEMLNAGESVTYIKRMLGVSESYVYAIKKQMAAGVEAEVEAPKSGEFIQADTNVDAILNERGSRYGSFKDVAEFAQEMKNAIRMCNNTGLDDDQIEALDMIASKIARIVNGDPNHVDSWTDIAGYATLVADRLQGKIR